MNDPKTKAKTEGWIAEQKLASALRATCQNLTDAQFTEFFASIVKGIPKDEIDKFLDMLKIARGFFDPNGSFIGADDVEAVANYMAGLRKDMALAKSRIAGAAAGGTFTTPEDCRPSTRAT